MTWTRLPDDFTDRPAVLRLSRSARMLHVEALVWCNRLLTDGVIPDTVLGRVSDSSDLDRDVAELAQAGLWTRVDDATWQVDWSGQEMAEAVERRRASRNDTQRRYNERRARHARDDHSMCDPRYCTQAGNAPHDQSLDKPHGASDGSHPTRPVPSRPEGEGEGQRGGDSTSSHGSAPLRRDSSAQPPGEPAPPWAGPPRGTTVRVNGSPVATSRKAYP